MGNEGCNRAKYIITTILIGVFMSACSKEAESETQTVAPATRSVPVIEEARVSTRIITDPEGYDLGEKMIVYVLSENEESTFRLVGKEAGDTVFVGELHKTGKQIEGMDLYIGDMTSFSGEGTFKLCTRDNRDGTEVAIKDGILEGRCQSMLEKLEKLEAPAEADECYRLSVMMLSGDIYDEESVDWAYVKKVVKEKCEKERQILESETGVTQEEISDRLIVAAVLADFYSVYGDIEPDEVGECLEVAVDIYDRCSEFADSADPVALYMANAALNRATRKSVYRKNTEQYEHSDTYSGKYVDFEFIADMIYLRSNNVTDIDRCNDMIRHIVEEADELSEKVSKDSFCVVNDLDAGSFEETLDGLMICRIADYVLSENAYDQVRRDQIHYLYGRNPETMDMTGDCDDIKTLSKLIFVMK